MYLNFALQKDPKEITLVLLGFSYDELADHQGVFLLELFAVNVFVPDILIHGPQEAVNMRPFYIHFLPMPEFTYGSSCVPLAEAVYWATVCFRGLSLP